MQMKKFGRWKVDKIIWLSVRSAGKRRLIWEKRGWTKELLRVVLISTEKSSQNRIGTWYFCDLGWLNHRRRRREKKSECWASLSQSYSRASLQFVMSLNDDNQYNDELRRVTVVLHPHEVHFILTVRAGMGSYSCIASIVSVYIPLGIQFMLYYIWGFSRITDCMHLNITVILNQLKPWMQMENLLSASLFHFIFNRVHLFHGAVISFILRIKHILTLLESFPPSAFSSNFTVFFSGGRSIQILYLKRRFTPKSKTHISPLT